MWHLRNWNITVRKLMIKHGVWNSIFVVFTNLLCSAKLKLRYMRNRQTMVALSVVGLLLASLANMPRAVYDTTDGSFSDKVFGWPTVVVVHRRLFVKSVVTEPAGRSGGVSVGPRRRTAIIACDDRVDTIYIYKSETRLLLSENNTKPKPQNVIFLHIYI